MSGGHGQGNGRSNLMRVIVRYLSTTHETL